MRKRVKLNDNLADSLKERNNLSFEALQPSKSARPALKNGNAKTLFTVKSEPDETPESEWSVERLGEFARVENDYIVTLNKRMAVHVWRLGRALTFAKAKVERGEWKGSKFWKDFLQHYDVSVPSDWRARELHARCPDEKKVAKLGITEAYRKFGLLSEPDAKSSKPTTDNEPSDSPAAPKSTKAGKTVDETPPPPKENAKTLTMFLAQVVQRLEFFVDEAAFIDQDTKVSPEHVGELIDQVIARLQEMKAMLAKPQGAPVQSEAKKHGNN